MKPLFGTILCIALISSTCLSLAAPVGNVGVSSNDMLKKGRVVGGLEDNLFGFVVGPEVDITFDRKLEDATNDSEFGFYGARAGVTVTDRVFIYALLGAGNAEQEFNISSRAVNFYTKTDFIWGVGISGIFYEKKFFEPSFGDPQILRIGGDFKYRRLDLELEEVTLDGTVHKLQNTPHFGTYEADEWQVALAASYQFSRFVPYLGIKFSDISGDAKATISGTEYAESLEADNKIGFFIGTDVLFWDSMSVNVEGRIGDEDGLTLGGSLKF